MYTFKTLKIVLEHLKGNQYKHQNSLILNPYEIFIIALT